MRFRRHSRDERLWGMLVTTVVKHMAAQVSNLQSTPNSDVVKYEIQARRWRTSNLCPRRLVNHHGSQI